MSIEILFICGGIYLLVLAGEKIYYNYEMYRGIHPKKVKEIPQEKYTDDELVKAVYDVNAFTKRMQDMREDEPEYFQGVPLYDSPPPPVRTDETGVEIITASQEKAQDERAGR